MWIWQASAWPHFKFDAQALQPALAAARVTQGRLLGVASGLQLIDLGELQLGEWAHEAVATAQIEGETLQINSVRASAARRLGLTQSSRARQTNREPRAEATLDVIEAAVSQWEKPLTEARLLDWHAALFPTGRSGVTRIAVGAYRTHADPMQIVTPQIGKPDKVHYQAPASRDVPAEMARLLGWFNDAQVAAGLDGVVRAALAHLWFEVIHPFEDGNGRVGRALSELALAQDMRSSQRLFSLSRQILLDRQGYYAQLHAASTSARTDVTPWLTWFIGRVEQACLASLTQIDAAVGKSRFRADIQTRHPQSTPSQRKVLNKLFDAGPGGFDGGMSTEKYVAVTGVSRATAYRELTQLVELALLEKSGQGRSTRYGLDASAWR